MSTYAKRRLEREFLELVKGPPPGIFGALRDNNLMIWDVIICGPDGTPWQGGTFQLSLEFSEDYPHAPPIAKFHSTMYHPNVFEDGTVCLDILVDNWKPVWSSPFLLIAIQSILDDPCVHSAANFEAARLFDTDRRAYNKRVFQIVELSWKSENLPFN
ncbi:Ubiquitin conjugating enzyme E2 [Rhynchospora pubera]|uniref:Ubiquitin conjugating enzyme E2 n=1 Tax=Rhynchospora pubera TaxID=906938 RepID=A0AAV8ENU0_9POAL|nr:Ubiquitin conjugating enzyme E2 [Rhynchospora pubera]